MTHPGGGSGGSTGGTTGPGRQANGARESMPQQPTDPPGKRVEVDEAGQDE